MSDDLLEFLLLFVGMLSIGFAALGALVWYELRQERTKQYSPLPKRASVVTSRRRVAVQRVLVAMPSDEEYYRGLLESLLREVPETQKSTE